MRIIRLPTWCRVQSSLTPGYFVKTYLNQEEAGMRNWRAWRGRQDSATEMAPACGSATSAKWDHRIAPSREVDIATMFALQKALMRNVQKTRAAW